MYKQRIVGLAFLLILFFLFLCPIVPILAQNCNSINIPTIPGNYERGEMDGNCTDEIPLISISADTVARNNFITITIDPANIGSPPYNWAISGSGFHFNNDSGPVTEQTYSPTEELQLWADSTACGSAIITVMDGCNESSTTSVREPNNGSWVLIEEISCGTLDGGGCTCHSDFYSIEGAYRYLDSYVAGNLMGTRWHPTGSCSPYPTTDYTHNYCYCVGYYPKKYHVGIHYKKKWRWDCP